MSSKKLKEVTRLRELYSHSEYVPGDMNAILKLQKENCQYDAVWRYLFLLVLQLSALLTENYASFAEAQSVLKS
jgi:hypothetical protein